MTYGGPSTDSGVPVSDSRRPPIAHQLPPVRFLCLTKRHLIIDATAADKLDGQLHNPDRPLLGWPIFRPNECHGRSIQPRPEIGSWAFRTEKRGRTWARSMRAPVGTT